MRSDLWQRRIGWVAMVVLILACGARAQIGLAQSDGTRPPMPHEAPGQFEFFLADGPKGEHPDEPPDILFKWRGRGDEEGHRYLGLHVREADAALRAQLGLDKQGLIVIDVAPESPAAKAGIKQHDVLVAVGDVQLSRVKELTKAVDDVSAKEISLKTVRGGKELTITVVPAERSQDVIRFVSPGGRGMIFAPGMGPRPALPDDVSLTVEREGKKPAKIKVKRGDDRWEIGEEELGKLPEDVRKSVAPFVAGMPMMQSLTGTVRVGEPFTIPLAAPVAPAAPRAPSAPRAPAAPSAPLPPGAMPPPEAGGRHELNIALPPDALRRLDEISARVEQLSEEIRRMRQSPGPGREGEDRPPPHD